MQVVAVEKLVGIKVCCHASDLTMHGASSRLHPFVAPAKAMQTHIRTNVRIYFIFERIQRYRTLRVLNTGPEREPTW